MHTILCTRTRTRVGDLRNKLERVPGRQLRAQTQVQPTWSTGQLAADKRACHAVQQCIANATPGMACSSFTPLYEITPCRVAARVSTQNSSFLTELDARRRQFTPRGRLSQPYHGFLVCAGAMPGVAFAMHC